MQHSWLPTLLRHLRYDAREAPQHPFTDPTQRCINGSPRRTKQPQHTNLVKVCRADRGTVRFQLHSVGMALHFLRAAPKLLDVPCVVALDDESWRDMHFGFHTKALVKMLLVDEYSLCMQTLQKQQVRVKFARQSTHLCSFRQGALSTLALSDTVASFIVNCSQDLSAMTRERYVFAIYPSHNGWSDATFRHLSDELKPYLEHWAVWLDAAEIKRGANCRQQEPLCGRRFLEEKYLGDASELLHLMVTCCGVCTLVRSDPV